MASAVGVDLEKATSLLNAGGLVAMPTETVYGLAADGRNAKAVAQIFEAKGRPSFDPLILHFAELEHAQPYLAELPELLPRLYHALCPGPLTFIVKKTKKVPDIVTAGHATVAIRFPKHPLAQKLLKKCNYPLAAPSANPFGAVSPTLASHVSAQLGDRVNYILDGGPCPVGVESTIIDLTQASPVVLRLGGSSLEEIESVLGQRITQVKTSSSNPKAPGMLSAHYSPGIKLLHGQLSQNLKLVNPARTGTITFKARVPGIPVKNQRILSSAGILTEAAAELFKALHSFNPQNTDVILAELFPDEGLGRAINDRLKRASVS